MVLENGFYHNIIVILGRLSIMIIMIPPIFGLRKQETKNIEMDVF